MKEMISNMKKHSCPSCGGQLRVDTGRQMYECPFCGLTYDYEYFREDDVLELASRSMQAGEFRSAKEAYEFMLQKEPHNFVALRGLILASAEAKDMDELRKAERYSKIKGKIIEGCIDRAQRDSLPEHKEYFAKMQELFETGREYREEIIAISKLRTTRKRHYSRIDKLEREKEENYMGSRESLDGEERVPIPPKAIIVLSLAVYLVWALFLIAMIWGSKSSSVTDLTKTTTKKATNSYARTQMVEKALESAMESEGVEPTEADSSAKTVVIKVGDIVDTANGDIASGDIITNGKETTKTAKNTTSGKTYKETAAEKKEKESKQSLRSVLVVSTAVEAGIIFFAVQRQKKINEVEAEIRSMSSQTEDISEEVNAREERLRELSKKIHLISNDLRKLNPLGSSGNSSGDGGGGSDSFPRVAKPKGL